MRISELRKLVRNDFLENDILSAKEAKKLVAAVVGDDLNSRGVEQLDKLRREFLHYFSDSGIAEYDTQVAKALREREASRPTASDSGHLIAVFAGRSLDAVPKSVKLTEVPDAKVRDALKRLDVNGDGRISIADARKLGLSEGQLKMFIYTASLMGARVDGGKLDADSLRGKKVLFAGCDNQTQLESFAESLGMTVRRNFTHSLDVLVVGNADATSKDERAFALNGLGKSSIHVATDVAFEKAARAADVPGSQPVVLSRGDFEAKIRDTITTWYTEHIRGAYEEQLTSSSPGDRDWARAQITEDMSNYEIGSFADAAGIHDRYPGSIPQTLTPHALRNRLGERVPRDNVEEWNVSFQPNYAGIDLKKVWLVDNRNGELLWESHIIE